MADNTMLLNSRKVLIVEDDKDLADMLQIMLATADIQTQTLYSGTNVLETAKTQNFDLIFLDIMMPGKDGFTVLKELKNDPNTKNVPVILLTNLGETDNMQRGLNLGAADYVIKVNVTVEKIRQLLAKHIIEFRARKNLHKD